jgi:hypothetical protein
MDFHKRNQNGDHPYSNEMLVVCVRGSRRKTIVVAVLSRCALAVSRLLKGEHSVNALPH